MNLTKQDFYNFPIPGPIVNVPLEVIEKSIDSKVSLNIKGRTLKNEVINGDFSNGTSGYVGGGATISTSNNIATVTGTGTNGSPHIKQVTNTPVIAGNKYYGSFIASVTNSVANYISLYFGGSISGLTKFNVVPKPIQGQKYMVSALCTDTSNYSGNISIIAEQQYTDTITANGKIMEIQKMFIINLTAIFGAGNEPTKEWCDTNLQWFDGIKSTGESEGNKIEVLTKGKNLFNDVFLKSVQNSNKDYEFNTVDNTSVSFQFIIKQNSNWDDVSDRILNGKGTFTTTNQTKYYLRLGYNGNKIDNKLDTVIYLKPNTKYYADYNIVIQVINKIVVNNIQIIEGTTATTYEHYKEDKLNILLKEPLRGLTNVADEIIGTKLIRRLLKILINDDTCTFYTITTNSNTDVLVIAPKINKKQVSTAGIITEIPYFVEDSSNSLSNVGKLRQNGPNYIVVFAKGTSLTEMKNFVNNKILIYELATPIEENVTNSISIFEKGLIMVNTQIPSSIIKLGYIREMLYSDVEWLTPKIDWSSQDVYNYYDLNRVENNTLRVYLMMKYVLNVISIGDMVLDRDYTTIEFADSLNRLEKNLENLTNNLKIGDLKPLKTNWKVGDAFNFNDANRYEMNLKILYDVLNLSIANMKYCGTFECGEEVI